MARSRGTASRNNSVPRHNNYRSNNNYYNNSSVAYDYALPEYDEYQEQEQQQVVIRRRKKKRSSKPKYVKAKQTTKSLSLSTYLTVGMIFACAFICVLSISKNTQQQRINSVLTSELKSLKDRSSELVVEVSQSMDLAAIENIARVKLQMSEPEAHQIVEISVPRQNYTVYNQTDELEALVSVKAESKIFSLSGIKNILFKD